MAKGTTTHRASANNPNQPASAQTAPTSTTSTAASAAPGFNAGNIFKQPGMANYAGPSGYGKTTTTVKPMTGIPGMKPTTTAKLPAGGGAGVKAAAGGLQPGAEEYIKAINDKQPASLAETKKLKRIVSALNKPVAEMLQMVETKDDVNSIKKFIDQTFTKYGAVNESAFAVRNMMIEHVTQVGAQRRREFARQS